MESRAAAAVVIVLLLLVGWLVLFRHPLKAPDAYPEDTELHYLSWLDHGRSWERAAAARKLVDMPAKVEYEITWMLRNRRRGLVRHMLTLCLFDMRPASHEREVRDLVSLRCPRFGGEGTWMKTDSTFKGQLVDFHFDWGGEAAIRLAGQGYAGPETLDVVYQLAHSYYPADRARAKRVFDAFEGIPHYDPVPQPKTINDTPQKTERQMRAIRSWLDRNLSRLRWSHAEKRYRLAGRSD